MDDQRRRVFAALSVLVVVWIAVYWATDPDPGGDDVDLSIAQAPDPTIEPPASDTPQTQAPASNPQTITQTQRNPIQPEPTVVEPDDPTPVATAADEARLIPPEFRDYTIQSGEVTFEDGAPTGALPGKLIRGPQAAPGA